MRLPKIVLLGFFTLALFPEASAMAKYETPAYQVLEKSGKIEIRAYQPYLIAEVLVGGERNKAANTAFEILAGYIFGANVTQKKMAMTAPVTQQQSQKIEMTAPMTQTSANGQWKVKFMMPSSFTLETLPKPNNDAIILRQEPEKKAAAIRFSGTWGTRNLAKNKKKLDAFLSQNGLKPSSEVIYAFYNSPFTLPFLRRNELMYVLE